MVCYLWKEVSGVTNHYKQAEVEAKVEITKIIEGLH